jgi:hypothetical protein
MPTILRIVAFRYFFYANEGQEPAHIHVQADNRLAKFWLQPVNLASNQVGWADSAHALLNLLHFTAWATSCPYMDAHICQAFIQ